MPGNKNKKKEGYTQMKYEGTYIHKFIKRTVNGVHNQRVGVIVAGMVDGKIKYGWSLARVKPSRRNDIGTDVFNEKRGLSIAVSRLCARDDGPVPLRMPDTVRAQLRDRIVQVKKFVPVNGKVKTVRGTKTVRGFETRARKYFKA